VKELSVLDNPKGNWNRHFETGIENKHLEADFSFIDDKLSDFVIKYYENNEQILEVNTIYESRIGITYTTTKNEHKVTKTIRYLKKDRILNEINFYSRYWGYLYYRYKTIPISYGKDLITDILLSLTWNKKSKLREKIAEITFPIKVMFIKLEMELWEKTLSQNTK